MDTDGTSTHITKILAHSQDREPPLVVDLEARDVQLQLDGLEEA